MIATGTVVAVKVAVVAPAATVTVGGTVAAGLLLVRVTMAPPAGAGPLRVTVPVEGLPPTTLVGFTVTEDMVTGTGVTISAAVCVVLL